MIALTTVILSPNGLLGQLGWFLYRYDFPFYRALSAEFKSYPIKGATLINVDDLKGVPVIELVVHDREKAPIIGLGSTKLLMLNEGENWRRLDEIAPGQTIVVPEKVDVGTQTVVGATWKKVKKVRSSTALHAIWCNTPTVAGTLLLESGGRSFATVAGFVLCRDDARG